VFVEQLIERQRIACTRTIQEVTGVASIRAHSEL
jgi:hypothetical protein